MKGKTENVYYTRFNYNEPVPLDVRDRERNKRLSLSTFDKIAQNWKSNRLVNNVMRIVNLGIQQGNSVVEKSASKPE